MSSEINKQKTTEWIFLSQLKWPSYASQSFKRSCYRCRKNEACSIILNISVMIPRDSVKSNSKSDIRQIENTNHTSLTVDLLRIEGECSRIKLARLFQEVLFVTLRNKLYWSTNKNKYKYILPILWRQCWKICKTVPKTYNQWWVMLETFTNCRKLFLTAW